MPRWNYYIQSVTKETPGVTDIGTIYKQKRPHDLLYYSVVEYHPPHHVAAQLPPPGPDMTYGFILHQLNDDKTELRYYWQLNLENYSVLKYIPGFIRNGIMAIVRKIILSKTRPAVAANFSKLRTLLETGEVVLQDGRTERLP